MSKINSRLGIGIHNRFDLEIMDAQTKKVKERAQALNVVCDGLYTALLTSGRRYPAAIVIGGGSGTPASSDTALFSYIMGKTTTRQSWTHESASVYKVVYYVQISNNEAVGSTITEIGLSYSTSNNSLTTHAMLQDMNGNRISIAKTSTDIINIYASIYIHVPNPSTTNVHTTFDMGDGSTYPNASFGRWLMGLQGYNDIDALSTGQAKNLMMGACLGNKWIWQYQNTGSFSPDIANKRLVWNTTQLTVSQWNNIGWEYVGDADCREFRIPLGATQVTGESVGVGDGTTKKFKTKFAYPKNATVYINGQAMQSGVSVLKAPPSTDYGYAMEKIVEEFSEDGNLLLDRVGNSYESSNGGEIRIGDMFPCFHNKLYEIGKHPYMSSSWSGTHEWYGSNDLETWINLGNSVNASHLYKYYKGVSNSGSWTTDFDGYNIVFDIAPANGDVITIDYITDCIPKDSDHVLDVSIVFQFGEYQGQ